MVDDTPSDILSRYGVKLPAGSKSDESRDERGAQSHVILKGYGVKIPEAAAAKSEPEIESFAPGKIPFQEDVPLQPTSADVSLGNTRGAGMQAAGAIPFAGPALNALTAIGQMKPGEESWGDRYTAAFNRQARADKAYAQEHPVASTLAQLGGSSLGFGLASLSGPGRMAMGMAPNLGVGPRMYAGGFSGAAINALDAAGRGEDSLSGALIGGVGGVTAPVLAEGGRGAANIAANYAWKRPGPLRDVPRPGINLLTSIMEGETPQSLAAARQRMGPQGFLGDLNPRAADIIGGISDLSIPEKAMVQEAYRQRFAQQGQRIDQAVTKATGIPSSFNVVEHEKFLTDARAKAADPLYEQWRTMQVHPSQELQALVPRLEKAGAFDAGEELSGISGRPIDRKFFVGGPRKDYPTTEGWDYVKRGLDSKIDQAYSAGDKTKARELVKLKGELVSEIEKTPAGQVWKQARSEFADKSALIDQLAAGRDTFLGGRAGLTPDELKEELRQLSRPEMMARIQGMRSAVRDAMGDRTEGASVLRSKLLAENNQKKMRMMLGNGPADELIETLKQEKYLADRVPAVVPNMNTGASGQTRAERRNLFNPPEVPALTWDLTRPSTYPLVHHVNPRNVAQEVVNASYGRTAPALAPIMLTRQGNDFDALLNSLMGERERLAGVNRALSSPMVRYPGAALSRALTETYRRRAEGQ